MSLGLPEGLSSNQLAAGVCAALFAFAFVAAPRSCEWGLSAYFWTGVVAVVLLPTAPFLKRFKPASARTPALYGLLYAGLVVCTWIAGLFAANVRIMCRLF